MKARGRTTTNPWREAFLSSNFKYVAIASVVVLGQGCVWYSGQFWALYFLQTVKKLDVLTSSYIVGIALLIATPTLIFWGWLSDKVGRKPIILGGMALASLTYYPLYSALGNYADPKNVNYPMAILIVVILVNYVGMTYGPIGAFLAEFFPSRIRYNLGVRALSHRQRLGWRSGPDRDDLDVPLHRQRGVCPDLSHRGAGRHVPDRHLRYAGDAQAQHLGGRGDRAARSGA